MPHDHNKKGISSSGRLFFVIILNLAITVTEYVGGIISGSLALMSDAVHNLSDVLSLILGYAGERISEKDPSLVYSFGMKRFEVIVALINALFLIVIGAYIGHESAKRFINPHPIDLGVMVPVALVGIMGNGFSILVLYNKRSNNLNLKAAFLHLFYDTLSSVSVLLAAIVIFLTGFLGADLIGSLIIVIMMVWSSVQIIVDSIRIFLQGTPKNIDPQKVYRSILGTPNVSSAHGLHIWSINSTEIFLSCHICIQADSKGVDTDEIIRQINIMLEKQFNITHTSLQIENNRLCGLSSDECCR